MAERPARRSRPPSKPRMGSGFDVYRFVAGDHVWLCGVRIDHDATLEGHSDADAPLHALTDAILGRAGRRRHRPAFPRPATPDGKARLAPFRGRCRRPGAGPRRPDHERRHYRAVRTAEDRAPSPPLCSKPLPPCSASIPPASAQKPPRPSSPVYRARRRACRHGLSHHSCCRREASAHGVRCSRALTPRQNRGTKRLKWLYDHKPSGG